MKRIVFALIFILMTITGVGQNTVYDTIQYVREYHQERLTLFKSEPIVKGKIVFWGDSITQFDDRKTLLNDAMVINIGIASDNTFGALTRLDDSINLEPSKLFL
jgi:hypothetical protein